MYLGVVTNPWAAQTSFESSVRFREALFVKAENHTQGTEMVFLMNTNDAVPQLTRCQAGVCHTFIPRPSQLKRLVINHGEHSPFSMHISYF